MNLALCLIILLIPIIGGGVDFGFEQSKVIFLLFSLSILGLIWLFRPRLFQIKWTRIKLASSIFTGSLLISSILGVDRIGSFFGKDPYFQGFILYAYLFLFSLMVSSIKLDFKKAIFSITLSSVLVSFVAIYQFFLLNILKIDIPNYAGRVVSTFGQPNLYSGFLLLALPFIYHGFQKLKSNFFYLTALILSVIGIVLSESRASILILSGLLLFWLLRNLKYKKISFGIYALFITISIFFFIQKEILQPNNVEWLTHNAPEKRAVFWPVLFEQYSKRWVQGYGLENIDIAFESYEKFNSDRSPVYYHLKNLNVDRAHNYLLDLLIFGGVLAFFPWFFLIWNLFKKTKEEVYITSLIIYLIWIQFQIQGVVHLMYFWLLVGLIDQQKEFLN